MTPSSLQQRLAPIAARAALEGRAFVAMRRAGALGAASPRELAAILTTMRGFGPYGGAVRVAALKYGDEAAIVDDRGQITYDEFEEQINRLCNAWRAEGLQPGATIGLLCRNHRTPLVASFAASRAGLNVVWLNTGFSARQATEVAGREGIDVLVHDEEFAEVIADVQPRHGRLVTATADPADDTLEAFMRTGPNTLPPVPARPGRVVLLTSGTTGTPKGAPRAEPKSLVLPAALLDRMPMRPRETVMIAPPLFHGTGLIIALLGISLGSRVVVRRRFDAAQFLDDSDRYRGNTWCVVPIMLQRILALGEEEIAKRDLSGLKVLFCAGSQLPAEVATRAQDVLGEVIYNLYGSTEVSVATLATPEDVRLAPTSVGKPALGSTIKLFDDAGHEVAHGAVGRIFVGTTTPFEGYTGGGHKEVIDGLMSTGDVGHFDDAGRLYIDGRDDEMIVSGGENVFPREIEELLVTHDAIADAAAIGVPDPDFGQRLKAFVVLRDGASVTAEEVQAFVKQNLARYKVPREVEFMDELPRNPTGKILKRQLAGDAS